MAAMKCICPTTKRNAVRTDTRVKVTVIFSLSAVAYIVLAAHFARADDASTNLLDSWPPSAKLELASHNDLWPEGLGFGSRKGTQTAGFNVGAGLGMEVLGGSQSHDLVLDRLYYGRVLTDVIGERSSLRGNLEGRVELMGGGQYDPKGAYLFGLTPVLRYNFATGSRWMPFLDAGAGVSVTDIGRPDLSTAFEFNLQAGAGLNYFLRENLALTLQYRFLHVSNAQIASPDLGMNANIVSIGLTWFF
jgi:opacity protein-like surface antigen